MHSFFGSRLSQHISETPEGFLICHSARLSRTAVKTPQLYRGSEIGLSTDDAVAVYRSAEEVTNRASLASMEGKVVCDGHPSQFLNSANAGWYGKGHVQHVREGDPLSDGERVIVGDLVITDAALIAKIKGGMKNISVGYDCEYAAREDGSFEQRKIRANHIAVVANGRAGKDVRILDSTARPQLSLEQIARQYHRKPVAEVAASIAAARMNDSLFDDWKVAQELNDKTVTESLIKLGVLREGEDFPVAKQNSDTEAVDRILRTLEKLIAQQGRSVDEDLIPVNDSEMRPRWDPPTAEDRAREARDYELSLRVYRRRSPEEAKALAAASRESKKPARVEDTAENVNRQFEADIRKARRQMLASHS